MSENTSGGTAKASEGAGQTGPVSVVIPVYNEGDVIEKVVRDFYAKVVSKVPGSELIVAEDGSTDNTKAILGRLAEELPIRLVSSDERKGYTRAVKDALKLPRFDLVFFSDSDGQQDAVQVLSEAQSPAVRRAVSRHQLRISPDPQASGR